MANIVNGGDVGLFISSGSTSGITATQLIAAATTHKLEVKGGLRKITSKDSGIWEESASAMLSWSVSSDSFVSFDTTAFSYNKIYALMIARQPITVVSSLYTGTGTRTTGSTAYVGQAYITSLSSDYKNEDNVTMSITLEGTGALAATTI